MTQNLPLWADALAAALLVIGAAFALIGSIGLARLSDFFKRLHGPSTGYHAGRGLRAAGIGAGGRRGRQAQLS